MTDDDAKTPSTLYVCAPVRRQTGERVTTRHLSPTRTPQDCLDYPTDIVIGIVEKRRSEAYEVRLRDVRGGPKPVRSVLIRLCRKIPDGRWMPMNEGSRCGLTIAASQISAVIDMLEKAEDRMADEGALP